MDGTKGKKTDMLYVFLLLIPFVIGGYRVWCSALVSCFLLMFLFYGRKDGARGDGQNGFSDAMTALICVPVMFLAAAIWGVDRGQACFGFVKFLPLPLFLVAVRQIPKEGRYRLWDAIPSGGIIMTAVSVGLWLVPATRGWVQVNGRLSGFFQYPNAYAAYLLCGILVRLERTSESGNRNLVSYLVLMAGLLLSGSRTVLVLAGVAMAVVLWHNRGRAGSRVILPILAGGLFLVLALLTATGNLGMLKRYLILPMHSSTFLGRLLYASDALPVIAEHPLGLGYMGYYFLQGSFQSGVYITRYAHNELLQVLLDVGWLPAVVLLYAVWRAFRRLGFYKRLMLIILLSHSLFDFDFQFLSLGCILVLLMGEEERGRSYACVPRQSLIIKISAMGLALFALWVGAVDFLTYKNQPEAAVRIYPAHTEGWMALLDMARNPEEADWIADRILRYNSSVSAAYDAKAAAAYIQGDAMKMVDYKLQAIARAKYEMEKYEDYFEKLFSLFRLYQDAEMTSSADYCRERLLEIPDMLELVKDSSSPIAWEIYDKPQLDLTEEMQAALEELEDLSLEK